MAVVLVLSWCWARPCPTPPPPPRAAREGPAVFGTHMSGQPPAQPGRSEFPL